MVEKTEVLSRRTLVTVENVSVKVPKKKGAYMNFVPEKKLGEISISAHWINGFLTPEGVIVFRHFFDLDDFDLKGRKIVAEVSVEEKTMSTGKVYVLLNIRKNSERTKSEYLLKFKKDTFEGIPVPGTSTNVVFEKNQRKDSA